MVDWKDCTGLEIYEKIKKNIGRQKKIQKSIPVDLLRKQMTYDNYNTSKNQVNELMN